MVLFVFWLQGKCTFSFDKHILYLSAHNFESIPTCIISEYHIKWRHGRLHFTCFYFSHAGISNCGRVSVGLSAVTKFDTKFRAWSLIYWEITYAWWSSRVPFLFAKQHLAKQFKSILQLHTLMCVSYSVRETDKLNLIYVRRNPSYVLTVSKIFRLFWAIYHMRLLCSGRRSPQYVGKRL